jgi:hypothetical protein
MMARHLGQEGVARRVEAAVAAGPRGPMPTAQRRAAWRAALAGHLLPG